MDFDLLCLWLGRGWVTLVGGALLLLLLVHVGATGRNAIRAELAHWRRVREINRVLFESHRYDAWAQSHARGPRRRSS